MDVRSLRVLHNDLLLELSVNVHGILFTFSIFKGEKCPVWCKKLVLLKVRDLCIPWNNTINLEAI
jgi:hypothetical protein